VPTLGKMEEARKMTCGSGSRSDDTAGAVYSAAKPLELAPCMSIVEMVNEIVSNTEIERHVWLDGNIGDKCTFGTDENRRTRKNELTYYKKRGV